MESRLKACTLAFYTTMAIIMPYLPLYFQAKGYSYVQLGLLYSTGPLMGIVSTLLLGILSDRFRTFKKIFLLILLGQLLCLTLVTRIDTLSVLIAVMLVFYFCQSPIIPLNDSMILHHIQNKGGSYASYRVWASIGFASSVVLFGFLIARYGLNAVPWIGAAAICVSMLCVSLVRERQGGAGRLKLTQFSLPYGSGTFFLFLAIVFVLSAAHRMNDAFISLFIRSMGAGEEYVGTAMLLASGFEIPIFYLLARYGDRFRPISLLTFASAVYTVRFIALGFVKEPMAVMALQSLHSLSFGIFIYAAVSYLKLVIPNEFRSTGQALFSIVWAGFAGIAAGMVGGYAFDRFGPHAVYHIAAALSLAAFVGFVTAYRKLNRVSAQVASDAEPLRLTNQYEPKLQSKQEVSRL